MEQWFYGKETEQVDRSVQLLKLWKASPDLEASGKTITETNLEIRKWLHKTGYFTEEQKAVITAGALSYMSALCVNGWAHSGKTTVAAAVVGLKRILVVNERILVSAASMRALLELACQIIDARTQMVNEMEKDGVFGRPEPPVFFRV